MQLGEQEARLQASEVDLRQTYDVEMARLRTAGAQTTEAQARILAGGERERAALDISGAGIAEDWKVLAREQEVGREQRRQLAGQEWLLGEQRARIGRERDVERAGLSLQAARSRLARDTARGVARKTAIETEERTYEEQLGSMAEQVMDYQLRHLPSLPDYEATGTRSALSMVFRTVADLADDD